MTLSHSAWLTSFYHDSTLFNYSCTWFYFTMGLIYYTPHDSTSFYHGSTSFYTEWLWGKTNRVEHHASQKEKQPLCCLQQSHSWRERRSSLLDLRKKCPAWLHRCCARVSSEQHKLLRASTEPSSALSVAKNTTRHKLLNSRTLHVARSFETRALTAQ